MLKKKTAPADKEAMAIKGAEFIRIYGDTIRPAIQFEGESPAVGREIKFTTTAGHTFTGTVAKSRAVGGVVIVEFSGNLNPAQTK